MSSVNKGMDISMLIDNNNLENVQQSRKWWGKLSKKENDNGII